MSTGAKVVPLQGAVAARGPRPAAPIPAMSAGLQPLHEQARQFLQKGLQRMFDAADDSLFEMAGQGGGAESRQEMFDAMRVLRLKREGVEKSVLAGLEKAFREVGAEQGPAVDVLPAGLLTLVSDEEMEETVALKTMVMRSLSDTGSEYNPLQRRLQALLGKLVSEDNNPLSARTLCSLMLNALRPLELKIQMRLLMLKLFEKHLLKDIGDLYVAINDSLIAAGVLPELQVYAPRPLRSAYLKRAEAESAPSAPAGASEAEPLAVLGELRTLLGKVRDAAPASAAPAGAVPVSQGDLTRLLSFLQRQPSSAGGAASLRQQLDAVLARATANSPRPRTIGKLDEDVITLVSMLFEQVLDDQELPETMRAPIADMQVPLLKAAIIDQRLFGEQAHPARQLLNEVTVAAHGSEDLASLQRDRVRGKIEEVSQRLRDEFTDDPQVFARLLEDFSRFTATEHKRAALLEQRLLEAEEARALRDNACQQVGRLLSKRLQGLTLPAAIVQGLERGWGGLLQLIMLRDGDSSDEWQLKLAVLDELLAQVSPLRNRDEAQLLLSPRRNELLVELRSGLEQVGFDPFEQKRFLQELTEWQRKLLTDFRNGVTIAPAAAVPAGQPAVSGRESASVAGEARHEDRAARPDVAQQTSGESESVAAVAAGETPAAALEAEQAEADVEVGAEHLAQVDGLGTGSWIELCGEGDAKQRCKLAAFIRVSGQFIFVNRAGSKVATHSRESLARAFASGAARLMDNAQPFDRALQTIIGNLREMRSV